MCGIVGYAGQQQAAPILLEGLSKLEYRGYDSAGICVHGNNQLQIAKCKGRLQVLADQIDGGKAVLKPMIFESDDIYLNYSTSAYGYVKLTIIDDDDEIICESDEIYGNELAHCIHVDGLAGRSGRIIIELKEADLYAIGAKG